MDNGDLGSKLDELSAAGYDLIIVQNFGIDVASVARRYPHTHYAVLDRPATELPNIANYEFATGEGGYLAGVVAALKTKTRTVGFIGGVEEPLIWRAAAGYEAGVRSVDPTIHVVSRYLGTGLRRRVRERRQGPGGRRPRCTEGGADMVYAAAGSSSNGVFQAALTQSAVTGQQLWAIGDDSDQWWTVQRLRVPGAADWSGYILTSVVKRYDRAMTQILDDQQRGTFTAGRHVLDLANDGFDLALTGGGNGMATNIADVAHQVAAARAQLISGQVQVPCLPSDRQGQDAGPYCRS